MTGPLSYVLGVDGGGTHTRAVILTPDHAVVGQAEGPGANPRVIGPAAAADVLRGVIHAALDAAGLSAEQIDRVGIGVAGADAGHSADWLRSVLAPLLPRAALFLSADYEIALVGALGERRGLLVLAGTGSLAYGVNARGERALAGAWGYLIDDPGSGVWIGLQALAAFARAADGRAPASALIGAIAAALKLAQPRDLIPWLYPGGAPRTADIAALAPLVLDHAAAGDPCATDIVRRACDELLLMARAVIARLGLDAPAVAFGGGLLSAPNPLSEEVSAALELPSLPVPQHPPVVGAALLALQSPPPEGK